MDYGREFITLRSRYEVQEYLAQIAPSNERIKRGAAGE